MILGFYRTLTHIGKPLIDLYLHSRKRRGKEDLARFPERLGQASLERPAGPVIWLHAASVGESLSALPLIERLCETFPVHVLVTTGTITSARLMAERLPKGAFHQYVPVDRPAGIRRFLDHWRPDLALWIESEFWPNLICETAARHVPLILLNGRISDRSFIRWQRFPKFIRTLLNQFSLCLGQSERDAERLGVLGAPRVACCGNLKFAVPPLPFDPALLETLQASLAGRPCWLAASTHAGEEAIIADVHEQLAKTYPNLLTVIVPRHPQRGEEIAALLRGRASVVALRSAKEPLSPETSFYVANTLGELGLFYRLCPISFIGRSLAKGGGQNPLEAARLGSVVLFGPQMENFDEIARRMTEAQAAWQVADGKELATAVNALLNDAVLRDQWADRAKAFAGTEADVLDRVVQELTPFVQSLR